MKLSLNINSNTLNLIIGSLILPSLLLPVRYSSLMLIIASIASIYNLISKRKKEKLSRYLFFPFIIYFLSIIISFILPEIAFEDNSFLKPDLIFVPKKLLFSPTSLKIF